MAVPTNGWLHAAPQRKYIMNIVTISNSRLCSESYPPREFSIFIRVGLKITLAKQNKSLRDYLLSISLHLFLLGQSLNIAILVNVMACLWKQILLLWHGK